MIEQEGAAAPETAMAVRSGDREADRRDDALLDVFFSDETEAFRSPCEPEACERFTVRLRVEKPHQVQAFVLVGADLQPVPMSLEREDKLFFWYEAQLMCGLEPLTYRFGIECDGQAIVYQKGAAHWAEDAEERPFDFRVLPGFHVPQWARGAVQYQIFPDRFANGNASNDVRDAEYAYNGAPVRSVADWDAAPTDADYRHFYGGDLQGVLDKLDYLQHLGVEAIYFNPLFVSPSSHGYDTQDYEHIDPHFGVIADDVDRPLTDDDTDNTHALQYLMRTMSPKNLKRSDKLFAKLCKELHRRGMRIILDGVFNHCGSFSRWMDREGIYRAAGRMPLGAYQSTDSPYRSYFCFGVDEKAGYEGWWDFPTLPKLNYEESPRLVEDVLAVARKWALPPYSIDGWRLDVAADVGHSERYNHDFWRRFRDEVKAVNPDLLIIAEHYGDVSPWLQGDQWDTVMNYDAFMDPLTSFLTGMEKHSDARHDHLYQDGEEFFATMRECMARFSWGSLLCAMNELSNHDHSRFLTRTNRMVGRTSSLGPAAASEGIDKRVMREAVVVQMTWPGAPTIYYADEAGQVGWTDPDCRRTYPWGHEDTELIELHTALARVRADHPALRTGSYVALLGTTGVIAFGRFLGKDRVIVLCNNADKAKTVSVRARTLGARDGSKLVSCLTTTKTGHSSAPDELGEVQAGVCQVELPPRCAIVAEILSPGKKRKGKCGK